MTKAEFMALMEPISNLVDAKHQDYNAGVVKLEQYFPFGHQSYVQNIHTKVLRLVSLVDRGQISPRFEPVEDTVMDCIAYCAFYLAYIRTPSIEKEKP